MVFFFLSFSSFTGKRYSESLAGTLLPDWIGKSLLFFSVYLSLSLAYKFIVKIILYLVAI